MTDSREVDLWPTPEDDMAYLAETRMARLREAIAEETLEIVDLEYRAEPRLEAI